MRSVYVIGTQDGPFKIGITRELAKRWNYLQSTSADPVFIHLSVKAGDTRLVKRYAHDLLKDKAIGDEWFSCDLETAKAAVYAGLKIQIPNYAFTGSCGGQTDFCSWVAYMKQVHGWTNKECAKQLGCGINQIGIWSRKGAPRYIGLACSALIDDMEPWTGDADAKAA